MSPGAVGKGALRRSRGQGSAGPRRRGLDRWLTSALRETYERVSVPVLAVFLLHDRQLHSSYGLTWRRKLRLARQMRRNARAVPTGTSPRAHMAMAAKIFSVPPEVEGVIVEAGCWKGGTTANLSLIADIVGRTLVVYDSFEGLPAAAEGDRWASPMGEGAFRGDLDEVRDNVARHGIIERCQFRKGWFSDTLVDHAEPIVAAFFDVDHQASMHQCVVGLWPHLVDHGYLFVDEYVRLDYCALFFSERFWRTYFDRPPPGLMGAGTGVAVGQYFLGPYRTKAALQEPRSIGWTRKDFYGEWDYAPDDAPAVPLPGGPGAAHGPEGWTTTTVPAEESADARYSAILASSAEARQRLAENLVTTERGQQKLAERLTETEEGRRILARALAEQAGKGGGIGDAPVADPS